MKEIKHKKQIIVATSALAVALLAGGVGVAGVSAIRAKSAENTPPENAPEMNFDGDRPELPPDFDGELPPEPPEDSDGERPELPPRPPKNETKDEE